MDANSVKEFIRSQAFKGIMVGVGLTIVILLIFQAGVSFGVRKASFAYRFGDNYYRTFGGPGQVFEMATPGTPGMLVASHGAAGKVVSVSLPTFVVSGPDNMEKVVLVRGDTLIRRLDGKANAEDIKVDDFTVVLGTPNNSSQIEAKLIRILPPPTERGVQIEP